MGWKSFWNISEICKQDTNKDSSEDSVSGDTSRDFISGDTSEDSASEVASEDSDVLLRILFLEMVLWMESAENYRILKESTAKLYKDEDDSGDHGETNTGPTMSTMQEKES